MTETQRLHARAIEPVSECLIHRLIVPDVYWEADWPAPGRGVDLLIIDHAGAGAVHVVEIKRRVSDALHAIPQVMSIPAHYRWVAFFANTLDAKTERILIGRKPLFPSKGPGCVGVIVVRRNKDGTLEASIKIPAERFPGSYAAEVDAFKAGHKPTISFG